MDYTKEQYVAHKAHDVSAVEREKSCPHISPTGTILGPLPFTLLCYCHKLINLILASITINVLSYILIIYVTCRYSSLLLISMVTASIT